MMIEFDTRDLKESFSRLCETLYRDLGLVIIALGVAVVLWWNVTQREKTSRLFFGVELVYRNLSPTLKIVPGTATTKAVSLYIEGPRNILEAVDSDAFVMVADLSRITQPGKAEVFLEGKNLGINLTEQQAIKREMLRVRTENISPRRVELELEWNSSISTLRPKISGVPAAGYIVAASRVEPPTLTVVGETTQRDLYKVISNRNEFVLSGEDSLPVQEIGLDDLDMGNLKVLNWPEDRPIRFFIKLKPEAVETRPIIPTFQGQPAPGYVISATTITPATITLAGSKRTLTQIQAVHNRRPVNLSGRTESFRDEWTLKDLMLGDLHALEWEARQLVRLSVTVEGKWMDRTFKQVPVTIQDASSESPGWNVNPNFVDITVKGSRLGMQSLSSDSLAILIDVDRLLPVPQEVKTREQTVTGLQRGIGAVLDATPETIMLFPSGYEESLEIPPLPPLEPIPYEEPPSATTGPANSATSGQVVPVVPIPPQGSLD